MNWLSAIQDRVSLNGVTDDRIIAIVPTAMASLRSVVGKAEDDEIDKVTDLRQATIHFAIGHLVMQTREISDKYSTSDSIGEGTSWGDGSIKPSAIKDTIAYANYWFSLANAFCKSYLNAIAANSEPRWYDI